MTESIIFVLAIFPLAIFPSYSDAVLRIYISDLSLDILPMTMFSHRALFISKRLLARPFTTTISKMDKPRLRSVSPPESSLMISG